MSCVWVEEMKLRVILVSPVLPLLLLLAAGYLDSYKPVIIVHGIFSTPRSLQKLTIFIKKAHPGTEVMVIDKFNNLDSLKPMWMQVLGFGRSINQFMQQFPDGVHLLCSSQGGLICRAVLSIIPNHNVHNFISLSSPLAGQYGATKYLEPLIPGDERKKVQKFCYEQKGQKVSFCNYWRDPHLREKYLERNIFLPLLNGEKPHSRREEWKKNFLRIKKLVLIGGPHEGVITPWQSSLFEFYDDNNKVLGMRSQEFYKNDTFGLRTLDRRGDVSVCTVCRVKHRQWTRKLSVFQRCIEKWLT